MVATWCIAVLLSPERAVGLLGRAAALSTIAASIVKFSGHRLQTWPLYVVPLLLAGALLSTSNIGKSRSHTRRVTVVALFGSSLFYWVTAIDWLVNKLYLLPPSSVWGWGGITVLAIAILCPERLLWPFGRVVAILTIAASVPLYHQDIGTWVTDAIPLLLAGALLLPPARPEDGEQQHVQVRT